MKIVPLATGDAAPAIVDKSAMTARPDLACVAQLALPWTDPVALAGAYADEPYAGLLLSGARGWSYLVRAPDQAWVLAPEADPALALAPLGYGDVLPDGPPFQGGIVGLAAYEFGARLERSAPATRSPWPDLTLARYPAILAFDREGGRLLALGRGPTPAAARAQAAGAAGWLQAPSCPPHSGPLAAGIELVTSDDRHGRAVAHTVGRIAAGEIFQANLARAWRGRLTPGARPYDLFGRLARSSPAGYAAYLRLPEFALVSNSPEQFLSVRDGWVESRPIKGTRPRGGDPARDRALACELLASPKDRAENLMIVDLMRNDLARVCAPGSVHVPELAALRSYANVHHLVSCVRGRLRADQDAWSAFLAAFPPGSITGAPKLQAMKVIADYEPPRGPYCGSLFWAGPDGRLEASVLIRTVALAAKGEGWGWEARAGGGIVADSQPSEEAAETRHKISAILAALTGEAA